jgi:hypothetical protein
MCFAGPVAENSQQIKYGSTIDEEFSFCDTREKSISEDKAENKTQEDSIYRLVRIH